MQLLQPDPSLPKGWYAGPWNSRLTLSIGYAHQGIDEPHEQLRMTEVYLVARGWAEVRVEERTLRLGPGDMLVDEPGEAHTFLSSSPDYFHFVIHTPGLAGEAARVDKQSVSRERLEAPHACGL